MRGFSKSNQRPCHLPWAEAANSEDHMFIARIITPIKGESTEDSDDEDEDLESSLSKGLACLYQKAIKAKKRVTQVYQEETQCLYYYVEGFEKNGKEIA
ncbi:412_t:CDS:2 [Acaulospora morrowiae]|uniref:412_t:CDS:1 n=1 Tax=Acaulospora morrowiae TaxID=94023 RepID=A0A9N8W9A0_9GLOM|nr:412_t:CDS:2 [Acaulospora morrowiae]